jgi:molybdate transport system substrate-binding protein
VLLAGLALLLAACGSSGSDKAADTTSTTAAGATTTAAGTEQAVTGTITVSAAASLTEAFTEIGTDFEAANPDAKVEFTFDSSGTLATQIDEGAPVDVFASADEKNMTKVEKHVDGTAVTIARNRLVIVTKPGNPHDVATLADLKALDIVSLCSEDAPCGTFSAKALESAGVTLDESKVTRGQNVKATLTAVTEGDADAAIVYATDAEAAGDKVATVDIPDEDNQIAVYPAAVLTDAPNATAAKAFLAYLQTDPAQKVLAAHGFLPPT